MTEYTVCVTTTYTAFVHVEAESEQEALEQAQYDVENAMVLVEDEAESNKEVSYEID